MSLAFPGRALSDTLQIHRLSLFLLSLCCLWLKRRKLLNVQSRFKAYGMAGDRDWDYSDYKEIPELGRTKAPKPKD